MQENIYRKPRLAIISDTGMYLKGGIFIFEPVFREVQNFSHLFSEIYWLGYAQKKYNPPHYKQNYNDNNELFIINEGDDSALIKKLKKYSKNKLPKHLKLFTIKLGGGNTYIAKMAVIFYLPYYLKNIFNLIRRADVIFTRGPSIPALLTVFISFLYPNKIFLHKYAGSWQLQSHTFSYRFQKWILQKNIPGIVTVNLRNNTDPHHIHSLFNPCLTVNELENNNLEFEYYKYKSIFFILLPIQFILMFVGHSFLATEKSMTEILLENMPIFPQIIILIILAVTNNKIVHGFFAVVFILLFIVAISLLSYL